MRHHFTKSERLAIKVMAALRLDFTDMNSGRIRRGKFEPHSVGLQARGVRRVVSFNVVNPNSSDQVGVRIFLIGREVGPREGNRLSGLTIWQIERIMVGYECHDGRVEWKQRDFFPEYRIGDDEYVASTDA